MNQAGTAWTPDRRGTHLHAQITFPGTTCRDGAPSSDEELVTLIHEGPLEKEPWRRLLRRLRERLHCGHAILAFHRRSGPGARFEAVVDCGASAEGALAAKRAYLNIYASLDPIPYDKLVPGRIYRGQELYDTDGAFFREFLHPQGIDDMLLMLVEANGSEASDGMRAWLTLARRSTQSPFTAAECAFMRSLRPNLATALRTFSSLRAVELERDIYRQALEGIAFGTLLIDQSGLVVRADNIATKLLEGNAALSIVDWRLRAANRADDSELREAIATAVQDGMSESPAYSRALRFSGCPNLTMLVRSLAPRANSAAPQTVAAVVYLSDTRAASTASLQQLVNLFHLSDMEAALALQLVQGQTLAQAARVLRLSEQTARTYSKHIFAKTGTNRQADLVRLILTSVAHLAA
jgi:DNA-binding CsgD family transcriptional regulator